MSIKKKINNVRRKVMNSLTKNIGQSYTNPVLDFKIKPEIRTILISRPNHRLGNQLLLTPLVQEVINTFPDCKIDLFVKGGVAYPVFENYNQVKNIFQLPKKAFSHLLDYAWCWVKLKRKKYDLVINGDKNSSSGRLSTQLANGKYKVFGDINEEIKRKYQDYKHISKYPVYNLRHYLKQFGFAENISAVPPLDLKLSDSEIKKGKQVLKKIVNTNKPIICIYTNATGKKCYSETWWETFYNRLLETYPEYVIIEMLPIENISKIGFRAPHFYSKDIREMGAIIHNTAIFIAADNGVMHLASASQNPTVGFFSVTNPKVYGPYGNGSFPIDTRTTTIEDWIAGINSILKT